MDRDFIPYQQAIELKELGFDEPCYATHYHIGGSNDRPMISLIPIYAPSDMGARGLVRNSSLSTENVSAAAPMYHQVFRWVREVYNMEAILDYIELVDNKSVYSYMLYHDSFFESNDGFKTFNFDEAQLECVKEIIKVLKEWTKYYKFGANILFDDNMQELETLTYIKTIMPVGNYNVCDIVVADTMKMNFYEKFNTLKYISYTKENEITKEEFYEKWAKHPKFRNIKI